MIETPVINAKLAICIATKREYVSNFRNKWAMMGATCHLTDQYVEAYAFW